MGTPQDDNLAALVLRDALLTREQLEECRNIQRRLTPPRSLAHVIVLRRYCTPDQLRELAAREVARRGAGPPAGSPELEKDDILLGRDLVARGILDDARLKECVDLTRQARLKRPDVRLAQVLLKKDYASREAIRDALARVTSAQAVGVAPSSSSNEGPPARKPGPTIVRPSPRPAPVAAPPPAREPEADWPSPPPELAAPARAGGPPRAPDFAPAPAGASNLDPPSQALFGARGVAPEPLFGEASGVVRPMFGVNDSSGLLQSPLRGAPLGPGRPPALGPGRPLGQGQPLPLGPAPGLREPRGQSPRPGVPAPLPWTGFPDSASDGRGGYKTVELDPDDPGLIVPWNPGKPREDARGRSRPEEDSESPTFRAPNARSPVLADPFGEGRVDSKTFDAFESQRAPEPGGFARARPGSPDEISGGPPSGDVGGFGEPSGFGQPAGSAFGQPAGFGDGGFGFGGGGSGEGGNFGPGVGQAFPGARPGERLPDGFGAPVAAARPRTSAGFPAPAGFGDGFGPGAGGFGSREQAGRFGSRDKGGFAPGVEDDARSAPGADFGRPETNPDASSGSRRGPDAVPDLDPEEEREERPKKKPARSRAPLFALIGFVALAAGGALVFKVVSDRIAAAEAERLFLEATKATGDLRKPREALKLGEAMPDSSKAKPDLGEILTKLRAEVKALDDRAEATRLLAAAADETTPAGRLALVEKAVAADKTFGRAHLERARARLAVAREKGSSELKAVRDAVVTEDLRRAIDAEPRFFEASWELATVQAERGGSLDAVRAELGRIRDADPDGAFGLLAQGRLRSLDADARAGIEALDLLTRSIDRRGDTSLPYLVRGHLRVATGDRAGATQDAENALDRAPGKRSPEANLLRGLARRAPGKGRADPRLEIEAALRADPRFAPALGLRALAAFDDGKLEEADADARRASEIDETEPLALLARAELLAYPKGPQGDLAGDEALNKARGLLRTALDRDDLLVPAIILDAQIATKLSELDVATKSLNRVIELDSKNAAGLVARARVRMARKKWGEAKEDLDAAISIDRGATTAFFLRARSIVEGDLKTYFELAVTDLTNVIASKPGNQDALFYRGYVLYKLANSKGPRLAEAITDLTAALEAAPGAEWAYRAHNARGMAYFYREKYDLAANDLKRAIDLAPRDINPRLLDNTKRQLKDTLAKRDAAPDNPWKSLGIGSSFETETEMHMEKPTKIDTKTLMRQTLVAKDENEGTVRNEGKSNGADLPPSEIKISFKPVPAGAPEAGPTAQDLGTETIEVPAGKFECKHSRIETVANGVTTVTETWAVKGFPVPVKSTSKNEGMTMTSVLTKADAKK